MIDLATTTKKYIRVDELMELLTVSRRTTYNWIENGKIPSVRIGGTLRIPVDELRKMMPTDPPDPSLFQSFVQSVHHR